MRRTPQQVGELVRARRDQVGLTRNEAATDAGMSPTTWANIESGVQVAPRSLRKAGGTLGWRSTWWTQALEGADPADLEEHATRDTEDYNSVIPRMPEHVKRAIDALIAGEQARER